jgi:hypothetical protein
MLKIANSNLQQYKEIMQYSPSKPKSLQMRELNNVVKEEVRSSKKNLFGVSRKKRSQIKKDAGMSSRDTSRFSKNPLDRSMDSDVKPIRLNFGTQKNSVPDGGLMTNRSEIRS